MLPNKVKYKAELEMLGAFNVNSPRIALDAMLEPCDCCNFHGCIGCAFNAFERPFSCKYAIKVWMNEGHTNTIMENSLIKLPLGLEENTPILASHNGKEWIIENYISHNSIEVQTWNDSEMLFKNVPKENTRRKYKYAKLMKMYDWYKYPCYPHNKKNIIMRILKLK